MTAIYAMAMRRRSAFALCREYCIAPHEIAPLLGVNEQQFLNGIYRDGYSLDEIQQGNHATHLGRSGPYIALASDGADGRSR